MAGGHVGNLSVKLIADLAGWGTSLTKAERQLVKTAGSFESLGSKLALGVTTPLLALGGVLAHAAAENAQSIKKMQNVFGDATAGMEANIQQLMKTVPLAAEPLREIASNVDVLVGSLGYGEKASAQMSKQVLKLAGDLAAFKHVSVEDAADALSKGLAGRTRGLVQFGVKIDEVAVKQRALTLGILKHGQELGTLAKAEATWSLIMEKTTKQQGEAARTINDAVNAPARFKQAIRELEESLGKGLLPAMNGVLGKMTEMVHKFNDMPDSIKRTTLVLGGLAAAIPLVLVLAGSLIRNFVLLKTALNIGGLIQSVGAAFAVARIAGTGLSGVLAGLAPLIAAGAPVLIGLSALAVIVGRIADAYSRAGREGNAFADALKKQTPMQLHTTSLDLTAEIQRLRADNKRIRDVNKKYGTNEGGQLINQNNDRINTLLARRQTVRDAINTGMANVPDYGTDKAAGGENVDPADAFIKNLGKVVDQNISIYEKTGTTSQRAADALRDELKQVTDKLTKMGDVVTPLREGLLKLKDQIEHGLGSLSDAVSKNTGVSDTFGQEQLFKTSNDIIGASISPDAIAGELDKIANNHPKTKLEQAADEATRIRDSGGLTAYDERVRKASERTQAFTDALGVATQNLTTMALSFLAARGFFGKGGGSGLGLLGANVGGGLVQQLLDKSAIGGTLGRLLSGKVTGALLGSILPGVGTLAGGIVGSLAGKAFGFIGGLFGHHKKAVDDATRSMDALTKTTEKLNESFTNIPSGFKVAAYRFRASDPDNYPGGGGGGGSGGGGGPTTPGGGDGGGGNPTGWPTIRVENMIVQANNPEEFYQKLGAKVERESLRGGVSSLTLAMSRGLTANRI